MDHDKELEIAEAYIFSTKIRDEIAEEYDVSPKKITRITNNKQILIMLAEKKGMAVKEIIEIKKNNHNRKGSGRKKNYTRVLEIIEEMPTGQIFTCDTINEKIDMSVNKISQAFRVIRSRNPNLIEDVKTKGKTNRHYIRL